MKKLIVIISSIVLFSCNKEEEVGPQGTALQSLGGKYLVCDSVRIAQNGVSSLQVIGKGKGMDIIFGLYGNFDIMTNPVTHMSYLYEKPDKIYYWSTQYDPNNYYTINSISSTNVVLQEPKSASGVVRTGYYSVEQ